MGRKARRNLCADEQKPHTRPTRRDELAQHSEVIDKLDGWLRSRVRLYYWKQWGRPRTRRRKLLKLGIGQDEVKLASRSRMQSKYLWCGECRDIDHGHWRMSHNSVDSASSSGGLTLRAAYGCLSQRPPGASAVQRAMNNQWLSDQGVLSLEFCHSTVCGA